MPHNDDSFWLSIFRKSPLIGAFMAVGGIIGLGFGLYYFLDERFVTFELVLFLITSVTLGGILIGLIVGVILDSVVGAFRSDDKKNRRRR
jgi:hypothetical protein